jgi:hypothetical protein
MAKTKAKLLEGTALSPAETAPPPAEAPGIPKPAAKFSLERFKSKRDPEIAGVEQLLNELPCHRIAQAKDFVRLHWDVANYWSDELCFVTVPIKGANEGHLHLIDEDLAMAYLSANKIQRMRLALACDADGKFFLCQVPTRNLINKFNAKAQEGCEMAKEKWVEVVSLKKEGKEGYKIVPAKDQDAFSEPDWPKQTLSELIEITFADRYIEEADHPGLRRLLGLKQKLS